MNLLDKIKQGIEYLPEKDISIARQLLEERDFEELIFLVESSLYKINDNINSSHPKEEYLDIDLEKLEYLLDNLNDYYSEITDNSSVDNYSETEIIDEEMLDALLFDDEYDD